MAFSKFFGANLSRFLCKRNVIILLMFLLFVGYFGQDGTAKYKQALSNKDKFNDFEAQKVKQFVHYGQYGTYGFRLLLFPHYLSSLLSDGGIIDTDLHAFIDSGERLKLYRPMKGKYAFSVANEFMTFTGFILLFGSLFWAMYGLDSTKDKEFLKFLATIAGSDKKICTYMFVSRVILLVLFCLLLAVISIILFLINGITLADPGQLIIYFLSLFLVLVFFLLIGMIAGTIESRFNSITVLVGLWIILVFLAPWGIRKGVSSKADAITPLYELEMEKLEYVMALERRAFKMAGKLEGSKRNTDIAHKISNSFLEGEFKKIMELEREMLEQMKASASLYQGLSIIFPTTFYLSTTYEISSRGFESLAAFYEHTVKLKQGFVRYYAEKNFFTNEKTIIPYIKGGQNIFYVKSSLPGNFGSGLLVNILWLVLLFILYWALSNRLFSRFSDIDKDLKPDFKKDKTTVVLTTRKQLVSQLLIKLRCQNTRSVYVPCPSSLPGDIKVKSLFSFFNLEIPKNLKPLACKYLYDLNLDNKGMILLEITRSLDTEIFIFNNFLSGLSDEIVDYFANLLKSLKKGRSVVYFSNSLAVSSKIADEVEVIRFSNDRTLS